MSNFAVQAVQAFKNRMWVPIELKEENYNDSLSVSINGNEKETQDEEEFRLTAKHCLCLVTLCCGVVLASLDYSGIGNIMGEISHDLGGTTTQTEWIGNAYSLAACVAQLPISSLSDISVGGIYIWFHWLSL